VFSRDAVWSGTFDQYAASKRKRGTSEVDSEFLKDIEGWRDVLARNLALRNGDLSADDLNAVVQRIIDRIIFLRMAEDRGLEPYGQLHKLCEQPDIYDRFMSGLCRKADQKYNSGLFHFQKEPGVSDAPDVLTPRLEVDDHALKPILQSLYFEHGCPYHFGVLPVEILGTVYERFLGKVIRLTAGHQAKVEEKPEVRKAGGVYYTPAYIVNYIVNNTIGKQIDGKSPVDLAGNKTKPPFRVLDMACGSGSFLLGAYQYLLDHCLKWYQANPAKKHASAVYQNAKGETRLTIGERKRILTTHIFGVDIDRQAVETTKLSLLLKALEGENDTSLSQQMTLFHERALPNLSDNIKCGNSLIASDFSMIPEDLVRVHAFDWPAQFPDAMKAGGFDAVIGNPPYVLLQTMEERSIFAYISEKYRSARYKIDTYQVFMEKALNLTKKGGFFGFITPNSFLRNKHAIELRSLILETTEVATLRTFYYQVFKGASVDTCILIACKTEHPSNTTEIAVIRSESSERYIKQIITQKKWLDHPQINFFLPGVGAADDLLEKIRNRSFPLGEIATAYFGIQTFDREKYVTDQKTLEVHKPVIDGVHIQRYNLLPGTEFVDFRPPSIKSGGKVQVYESERIGVRQIGKTPIGTIIPAGVYSLNTIYNIFFTKSTDLRLRFILGLLSSSTGRWFWEQSFFDQKETFPKVKKDALLSIPIPRLDLSKSTDRARHDRLVELVEKMLALTPKLRGATSESEKAALQNAVTTTDTEIDRLVYELYGLTEEEIKIVEGE